MVIMSLNRIFWGRPFTKVIQKMLKGVFPSVADVDSSKYVVFRLGKIFVTTSLLHGFPRKMLRCACFAVGDASFTELSLVKTAARRCAFCAEASSNDDFRVPAGTLTFPRALFSAPSCLGKYRELPERFTYKVCDFTHNILHKIFVPHEDWVAADVDFGLRVSPSHKSII